MEVEFLRNLIKLYQCAPDMTPDEAQAELDALDRTVGATMSKRELAELKRRFLNG